jgi:hypothetical protein
MTNEYGVIAACAQDFLSALSERPKIARVLLRFVFGKVAYREFVFLADCFIRTKTYMNYELNNASYHKEEPRKDFSEGFLKY